MSCIVRIASMPWLNVVSRFFSGVSFFAVECESEVEFDNTEGLMDHRRPTQAGIYEELFWLF